MENNLFGNPLKESKRDLNDYFIIKPFSVLNTMDNTWMRRKAWWNSMIEDRGASRENVLFKKTQGKKTKIGKLIQDFNDGVSLFDPVLSECMVRWFSEKDHTVLDPFAGDETRGFVSCYLGRKYTGFDIRLDQVTLNSTRLVKSGFETVSSYIHDSSINLDNHVKDSSVDFVFTCPPYLWLEKYSDDPMDLSTMKKAEFFKAYTEILRKSYIALKDNRFAVIVVSEVRDKDGTYVSFVPRTVSIMLKAGFSYYNEIILANNVGTLRLRVGNQMNSGRKVGRLHQNVLIFYKGDPNKIKDEFSVIIPKND